MVPIRRRHVHLIWLLFGYERTQQYCCVLTVKWGERVIDVSELNRRASVAVKKKGKKILHYLNTCHVNIKFTIEFEENNAIPFLDILIKRSTDHTFSRKSLIKRPRPCRFYEPTKLSTPNKPLFSQNRWSAKPGLGRCYLRLCSSPLLLRSSLDEVKMLLTTILMMSTNQGTQQPWYLHGTPPPLQKKKKISLVLPYLGLQSKIIIKQLKACINIFYGCNDLRFIFQNTHRIKSLFPYKDRLNRSQISKELVVGTVRISTLAKPNGDCMIEKLNTSRQSSAHHQSTFPHFQS